MFRDLLVERIQAGLTNRLVRWCFYTALDKNANNRLEEEERRDPILGAQEYMKPNALEAICPAFFTTGIPTRTSKRAF